ncbi:hypothetical protein Scep_021568 [Stephania cephalantha]|uniref:Uncharacterized protein n=1 Tax=Stephania cephalantha TaxID=152367 RepID=A0AAP0FE42_9MAGN
MSMQKYAAGLEVVADLLLARFARRRLCTHRHKRKRFGNGGLDLVGFGGGVRSLSSLSVKLVSSTVAPYGSVFVISFVLAVVCYVRCYHLLCPSPSSALSVAVVCSVPRRHLLCASPSSALSLAFVPCRRLLCASVSFILSLTVVCLCLSS